MAKSVTKNKSHKRAKGELLKDLRIHKKELQRARFRLSVKDQQKTSVRRVLRKNIARTATLLTEIARGQETGVVENGKIADDGRKSAVSETAKGGK